ncbi:MAG: hypothetical protein QNJ63_02385 [Calothrix sp. MO_192.B10]|nr:hypothetical protein [Calothrix sp. MO_192.B10]
MKATVAQIIETKNILYEIENEVLKTLRDFQVLKYPHIKGARNAPLQVCWCIWDNLFFGIPLLSASGALSG